MFYVYVLYRPWDMTPCYVGKGKGRRVDRHRYYGEKHPNSHLARIYKKAGGPLPHEIVFTTDDEQAAFAEEMRLIALYGRYRDGGTLENHTDGGEGCSNPSDECRRKNSEAQKGNTYSKGVKRTEEQKLRQSLFRKGKKATEETKKKLSLARIGNKNALGHKRPQELVEKSRIAMMGNKHSLGYKHSQESRDRMSKSNLGIKRSEETKRKHSEIMKEKWADPVFKEKRRARLSEGQKKRYAREAEAKNCGKLSNSGHI